jgi:hypothetical protein
LFDLLIGGEKGNASQGATLAKASDVVGQAKKAMLKRSDQIRDRRTEDEAGVVKRQAGFRLRQKSAVEVSQHSSRFWLAVNGKKLVRVYQSDSDLASSPRDQNNYSCCLIVIEAAA